MRKIYIVPNLVTTANMFCGYYSVLRSIEGDFWGAAWAIIFAAVFDMLDGRIARMAKATSAFGVQYDSLSDLVSFGIAPALLIYQWTMVEYGRFGIFAAFLFAACAALRLARFNVNAHVVPKAFFQGLPTPGAAGIVATYAIFQSVVGWPAEERLLHGFVLFLNLALSVLMVSSVRFPSFKELNWRSRASFGYLLVGLATVVLIAVRPEVTLFLVGVTYIAASLAWNVLRAAGVLHHRPDPLRTS